VEVTIGAGKISILIRTFGKIGTNLAKLRMLEYISNAR
jgi:hypothetical protein